jgi:hypothetical protein
MTMTYTHVSDLAKEVQPPDKGILSRTLFSDDTLEAKPGTWVHIPAGLKHGILARTPVVMLLMLLKGP